MIFPVSRQAYVFLCTVAGGMAIALVYDIFRIIRKAVRTGSLLTYAEDIVYWVISAAIMLFTIYYSNEGEIRGFLFVGTIIGVVLYSSLFSKIVMESSLFIINMTIKIVKAVMFVILYPFRLVLKILAAPVRKLAVFIADSLRKAGYSSTAGNGGKKRFRKIRLVRKFVRRVLKRRKIGLNKNVKS
ncbi:MAG TPA: spore cortex biosynthesis protein YabQ [Clostridia bacterium]|nr:spore cortex biosynthesis protein YabQ [Clostridia bacterium]